MTSYTVEAIPTLYRGRQYRSRLEAKWAAFFDLLGWAAEYEPLDFGSWSPDALMTRGRCDGGRIFVEVKPITRIDLSVCKKMEKATRAHRLVSDNDALLLLGASPMRVGSRIQLGWFNQLFRPCYQTEDAWWPVSVGWIADPDRPVFRPDIIDTYFMPDDSRYWGAVLSGYMGADESTPAAYCDHTLGLWARAANAVQWRGEGAQP